jgi:hypothetical protein
MFDLTPFRRHRNAMENFWGRDLMRDFLTPILCPPWELTSEPTSRKTTGIRCRS